MLNFVSFIILCSSLTLAHEHTLARINLQNYNSFSNYANKVHFIALFLRISLFSPLFLHSSFCGIPTVSLPDR